MSTTARRLRHALATILILVATATGAVVAATPAAAASAWLQVDAGGGHTCGIKQDRTLWCWGDNRYGQLGVGSSSDGHTRPVQVSGSNWAVVAAGAIHTCALTTTGFRYCWGENHFGQLGLGDSTDRAVPTRRTGGRIFIAEPAWATLSAAGASTCGVTTASRLYCWGDNRHGQLGLGDDDRRLLPARLDGEWTAVTTGDHHTCGLAVVRVGTAYLHGLRYCWGHNQSGELGLDHSSSRDEPARLGGESPWDAVAAGTLFTCGVRETHGLYCWGDNGYGELGVGDRVQRDVPAQVGSSTGWRAVTLGNAHACGLKTNGTRYCWGYNGTGQLGIGDQADRTAPRRWVGEFAWDSLSAGWFHTCGIRTNGSLYCWGENGFGQLGLGHRADRSLPARVQ